MANSNSKGKDSDSGKSDKEEEAKASSEPSNDVEEKEKNAPLPLQNELQSATGATSSSVPLVATTVATTAVHTKNGNNCHRKMMTNLPKRPPVLLNYTDLVYTVRERSGKWFGGVVPQTTQILHGVLSYYQLFMKLRSLTEFFF